MSDLVGNPEDRFSRVAAHLRAMNIFKRRGMGHTAVSATYASSVTLKICQHVL